MSSDATEQVRRTRVRRGLWSQMSIQSKLLTMLLLTSIVSALLVGYFGYRSGSHSLHQAALDKVTAIRDARTRQIQSTAASLARNVILNSANESTTNAVRDLSRDFDELQDATVTPAQKRSVERYYETVWRAQAEANVSGEVNPAALVPTNKAELYLEANYTAPHTSFDQAIEIDDAGDGSQWSKDHARYHPYFRELVQRNGFEDAMLLDTRGNVVYTAYKGIDLGTNIIDGPFKDSSLEQQYRSVLRTNSLNSFAVTDFEPYQPSGDQPTAFGLSPVGIDGKLIGVLAVQLPIGAINDVMTTGRQWKEAGYGTSGESYLVGPDDTLRSTSRVLVEDPKRYREESVDGGTSPALADQIVATKTPILRQRVSSPAVAKALEGKTGTEVDTDFLGRRVITAYGPAGIDGEHWAVIAQVDEDEALAPVSHFLRSVVLALLALVLLVTIASIALARAFSRPVARMLGGVRQVAAGDLDARVEVTSRDEFAALGRAFNDMAVSLSTQQELLDAQLAENNRMLRTLMPEPVAARFREGERTIVDEHVDVSLVYAGIDGLDEFAAGRAPDEALALVNDLFAQFETTAVESGVERVRTLRSGFVACCGLTVPRVDHASRIAAFAVELRSAVARFNAEHGAQLRLRAGLDSGAVTTGLVGSSALYDMWGDTVNVAYAVQAGEGDAGIYLSQRVYDAVRDLYATESAAPVVVKNLEEPVWRLVEERSRA